MFSNPFAALAVFVPPLAMQAYLALMIVLVVAGTLFDMVHKGNAAYFFANRRKARARARREVGSGGKLMLALETAAEALVSGEFCSTRRRMAHLLAMYGFILYATTTIILVFGYAEPLDATPPVLPLLWYLGALLICIGGYWFWFFIRADVVAEGGSPFRLMHADLFILSLLGSATLAPVWPYLLAISSGLTFWALGLYLIATTVLFGSVPWSKFSHMFYKPAAAYQRRLEEARGSRMNLPRPADQPELFGGARGLPRHY